MDDFNFDPLANMGISTTTQQTGNEDSLQRTDEWKQERCGNFTASRFKDLMTCKSRAKGKNWGKVDWILDFGDTAIAYIIEKAIERATGQPIETPETWHMKWGNHYEPEGKAAFAEKNKTEIEEVGFIKFMKHAGASPDGFFKNPVSMDGRTQFKKIAFELKCPATVLSHYKLSTTPVDESHDYFWQVIGEMLALKTDKAVFCSYDPRYPKDFRLNTKFVELSEMHANALKARIIIADHAVIGLVEDFRRDPRAIISGAKKLIPTDYSDFLGWLQKAEKDYLI